MRTTRRAALLLVLLAGGGLSRPAAAADLPADLALVPADAVGFVHVRLADAWKSDLFAPFRDTLAAGGPKAAAALEEQIDPPPSAFDRVTLFFLPGRHDPEPILAFAFSKAIDPARIAAAYFGGADETTVAGKKVLVPKRTGVGVHAVSDRLVIVGPRGVLADYLGRPVAADGALKAALAAAPGKPLTAAINVWAVPIPAGDLKDVPEDLLPLFKARTLVATADFDRDPTVRLAAEYADAADAAAAGKALAAATKIGKAYLAKTRTEMAASLFDPKRATPRPPNEVPDVVAAALGLGAVARLEKLLDAAPIKAAGPSLTAAVTFPKELTGPLMDHAALATAGLFEAAKAARASALRMRNQLNLKLIGLAALNFEGANQCFPEDVRDKDGKPLLSWRVQILPYLEQANLADQFKLDQPWDVEANAKAAKALVKPFMSPNAEDQPALPGAWGWTHYVGISGPGTVFDPAVPRMKIAAITDGLSNTIMAVETPDPVPWAKPGDLVIDPDKPLPKFMTPGSKPFNVLMCDGFVRSVDPNKVSEKTLRGAFTRAGGEVLGDW